MKITALKVRNYRTLEAVDLTFPCSYAAVCGPNDSGKTNIIRAVRTLMKEEPSFVFDEEGEEFSIKADFPKWLETPPKDREINLQIKLTIDRRRDAGIFQFLIKQLSLETEQPEVSLTVDVTHRFEKSEPTVQVTCLDRQYSDINAQQVLNKLQSSRSILFHNSTQIELPRPFRTDSGGYIRPASPEHETLVTTMKAKVNKGLAKISKSHQQELENLLGRLETKYKVALSIPAFDFTSVPFRVTLGQKKCEVPLDDWGSGTKNRTLILLRLFRARQMAESETSASKVTPVIVVEEPESFLHPAAQAEFGRVLQDLSKEFQVQVIVTTHSPYLLSIDEPKANILLRRRTQYNQLRNTELVDTSGENWMKPFGLALGLESEEFKPWKELMLSGSDAILLVEGDTDKQYFEMLRDSAHGANRLEFSGDIVDYDGTGALQNTVLLRFVKNRFRRLFVTYDLDCEKAIEKSLTALELKKKEHYIPVGLNAAGKRNIEGLLPDRVTTAVFAANPALVQAVASGNKEEREQARRRLKQLLLDKFRTTARPGQEDFGHFYALAKLINKALA